MMNKCSIFIILLVITVTTNAQGLSGIKAVSEITRVVNSINILEEKLVVGTEDGLFLVIPSESGHEEKLNLLENEAISNIVSVGSDRLLLATYNNSLYELSNLKDLTLIRQFSDSVGLTISNIQFDPFSSKIYVANAASLFVLSNNLTRRLSTDDCGQIVALSLDIEGIVYLGTEKGIFKLNIQDQWQQVIKGRVLEMKRHNNVITGLLLGENGKPKFAQIRSNKIDITFLAPEDLINDPFDLLFWPMNDGFYGFLGQLPFLYKKWESGYMTFKYFETENDFESFKKNSRIRKITQNSDQGRLFIGTDGQGLYQLTYQLFPNPKEFLGMVLADDIIFKSGRTVLENRAQTRHQIRQLEQLLTEKTNYIIQITGYTGDLSVTLRNSLTSKVGQEKKLSLRRAEKLKKILVKKGISPLRINVYGGGRISNSADYRSERFSNKASVKLIDF